MTDDPTTNAAQPDETEKPGGAPESPRRNLMPPPGLAAIGLYMLVLAGVSILGVAGGKFPPIYLVFSATFIAAALGLLMMLRWAWALTLGAVVLLMALFGWKFAADHQGPYVVQGLLNLVFFLYLIRAEVRGKLH